MSIEQRSPPPQLAFRLKRALGGRAGWGGFALQIAFVVLLVWIGYEIIANARVNLETQHITSGFGFLKNTAGFDVSQNLIPYSGSDPYTRVFLVGLLNTLLVSVIGIFFATVIGFLVALGRLSPNWLLSRIGGAYVEGVRNIPVLFQILFWYLAVLGALPGPRQSISLFGSFFLSNRGLIVPKLIAEPGLNPFVLAVLVAIVASLLLHHYARRQLFEKGRSIAIWPYVAGMLIGLPLVAWLVFGAPFKLEFPLHRRDRALRHPRGVRRPDRCGARARPARRRDQPLHRDPAGAARDPAAADQPVSQPDQELLARGGDRLS